MLGIRLQPGENNEALVYSVMSRGGGAKAGLRPGDIITKVNGLSVSTVDEAIQAVGSYLPGETVRHERQT